MATNFSPLIKVKELLKLTQSKNLVIVDASIGENAKSNYYERHLDGALFVDLNTQLANIKQDVSIGGRHPLATIQQFSETLNNLGITEKSHVVIYDDKNGAIGSRFWWMLKSIGHNKVQVLDGGFQEAEKEGFPINSKVETARKTDIYNIKEWKLPQAHLNEVEIASQNKNYIIIDVRERDRFNGMSEPLDLIAGHIPGAINIPFASNLDEDGLFRSPEELRTKDQNVLRGTNSDNIIVHCGSGVTACHTLLAMDYAGLEIPKLYVGSWSEWSRNNKTMVTKRKAEQP